MGDFAGGQALRQKEHSTLSPHRCLQGQGWRGHHAWGTAECLGFPPPRVWRDRTSFLTGRFILLRGEGVC